MGEQSGQHDAEVLPLHAGSTRSVERAALRGQAFALSCQGLRAPAIAARLGVSAQTIRRWLRAIYADLAAEPDASADGDRHGERSQAVESQRAIAAAAWAAFEREQAAADEGAGTPQAGARYLSVALAAQREAARLLGLYGGHAPEQAQVRITLTRRPETPETLEAPGAAVADTRTVEADPPAQEGQNDDTREP